VLIDVVANNKGTEIHGTTVLGLEGILLKIADFSSTLLFVTGGLLFMYAFWCFILCIFTKWRIAFLIFNLFLLLLFLTRHRLLQETPGALLTRGVSSRPGNKVESEKAGTAAKKISSQWCPSSDHRQD
jgi:hypothetical protein